MKPKKITIINKSDSTGGAAVVSYRLMEALRAAGADARMLVVEKLTDSPWVFTAAPHWREKIPFLKERLEVFAANGFDRSTLFKIDTASAGLPLWQHPLVKDADAILLNWVNQGMLSLRGIGKILKLGKPVAWTMHDMWCLTGVCHHAGSCRHFENECGDCPLLGRKGQPGDISHRVWEKKQRLYAFPEKIKFVAVSNWLADKARQSSLLADADLTVIPNAFSLSGIEIPDEIGKKPDGKIKILFGAARLDDSVKGLPALREAFKVLRRDYPEIAGKVMLETFGTVKAPEELEGFEVDTLHHGMVRDAEVLKAIYRKGQIVVSSSTFETLPGTLVEAQAHGCIPVAFDSGGQRDIVEDGKTGFLCSRDGSDLEAGDRLARALVRAVKIVENPDEYGKFISEMRRNVEVKFSAQAVAQAYLSLLF